MSCQSSILPTASGRSSASPLSRQYTSNLSPTSARRRQRRAGRLARFPYRRVMELPCAVCWSTTTTEHGPCRLGKRADTIRSSWRAWRLGKWPSLFGGATAPLQILQNVAQMNGPLCDAGDNPTDDSQHNAEQYSAKTQRDPDHPQRDPDKDPDHLR